MIPDIKLNGTSVASMGWLRETISFPVPVASQYDCGARKELSHSLYRSSGACILSASELFFNVFYVGNKKEIRPDGY